MATLQSLRVHERSENTHNDVFFALLDIDYFKKVNDEFGHVYGDEVLLRFAQILKQSFRHYDQIYRYGGEEFCIILFQVDASTCSEVLERFRKRLESFVFPRIGRKTISIGYTKIQSNDQPNVLLDRTDRALYFSKEHGRNQVNRYEDLFEQGLLIEESTANDIELF